MTLWNISNFIKMAKDYNKIVLLLSHYYKTITIKLLRNMYND